MTSTDLAVVTWTCVAVIIISAIMSGVYIQSQNSKGNLIAKRRWIQQLPSLISTLGVLGTFFGITIGLIFFDTSDLDKSIPLLLEGLKTAFFTSLAGMIGSLLLSRQVSTLYDNEDKGVSDVNIAAGLITESVRKMSETNVNTLETLMAKSETQTAVMKKILEIFQNIEFNKFSEALGEVLSNQDKIMRLSSSQNGTISEIKTSLNESGSKYDSIIQGVDRLNTLLYPIGAINEKVNSTLSSINQLVISEQHVSETITNVGDSLKEQLATIVLPVVNEINDKLDNQKQNLDSIKDNTSVINTVNDNLLSSIDALGNLDASEQHVSEEVDAMSQNMTKEIRDMNNVLKAQLSEVSEFIAKQNTQVAEKILAILTTSDQNIKDAKQTLDSIHNNTSSIPSINDNVLSSLDALGNLDASEQHVSEEVDAMSDNLKKEIREMNNVLKAQLSEVSEYIAKHNAQVAEKILSILTNTDNTLKAAQKTINDIHGNTLALSTINDNILSSLDALGNLDVSEQHVSEEIDKLGNKMSSDIDHIVTKMDNTNSLLDNKFTEFSELLAKNNTEMMLDVMKDMAEQFQDKMNEVINKLVHDNFEDLKQSIDRLNQWQKENKQMVADMIADYNEMQNSFENTSTTLSDVETRTRELVADDGKLKQLIESINKVILENKNFETIAKDLQDAASINKANAQALNSTSVNLDSWVKRQQNFADGVKRLMMKLDEINKIKDYGSDFWKETRTHFEEGINLLTEAGQKLNHNVSELDKHFYSRLSTTLANLDACIQAMYDVKMNQYEKE